VHEPHLLEILASLMSSNPGAVIDVGANTGQTLLKFLALKFSDKYIAIEPNLWAAHQVALLAEANDAWNVQVVAAALSSKSDVVFLNLLARYDQGATIKAAFRSESGGGFAQMVPTLPGDAVVSCAALERVSLIKIDAEGSEADVLAGFARTLDLHRPTVICELIPLKSASAEVRSNRLTIRNSVVDRFRALNYILFSITAQGRLCPVPGLCVDDDSQSWEYLFVPSEMESALSHLVVRTG
jgi:FkbM family methyltransferase